MTGVERDVGFLRAVLRKTTDVIAVVDGEGRLGYVSVGATALLGYRDD